MSETNRDIETTNCNADDVIIDCGSSRDRCEVSCETTESGIDEDRRCHVNKQMACGRPKSMLNPTPFKKTILKRYSKCIYTGQLLILN